MRRKVRGDRGSAPLETAIVIPVFFLLLAVMVGAGRLWSTKSSLTTWSMCWAAVMRPAGVSHSVPASAGSSSTASTSARAALNAPNGSSCTEGAGLSPRPTGC